MRQGWKFKMVLLVIAAVIAMGAIVMWLWNWLIPDLFHGPYITFIQSMGLMLLTRILFRGFYGMKGRGLHYGNMGHWKEKYDKMSPEEKEKMRDLWQKRCSTFGFKKDMEEEKK